MPTITPGDKLLVTGANGFIAMWVIKTLLEKGYSVRGTVRSVEKSKYVQEYFKDHGDRFELVALADMTLDGAFDEVVKGVDGIAHTASPFHENVDDPEEFIRPAVDGTVGVLKSALKSNPNIKRIVITSSCAAVITIQPTPRTFSEKDWNETSIQEVREQGRDALPMTKYRASKTLAEKAAWNFYEDHKSDVKWDIAVLNPPFVFGPPIQEIASPDKLNTSAKAWYDTVLSGVPKIREALGVSNAWVDVRDLAAAHVLALEKEEAGGERIIISEGPYIWQEWLDLANSLNTSGRQLFKGFPDLLHEKVYSVTYEKEKQEKILGIKFYSKEETTRDTLANFSKRGW